MYLYIDNVYVETTDGHLNVEKAKSIHAHRLIIFFYDSFCDHLLTGCFKKATEMTW